MGQAFSTLDEGVDQLAKRAELAAVLASKLFARAPMRSRMLNYLCEKVLCGETADISEYGIAVEALGRKADFDPESDSIVRVEAFRLRQRLKEFYAADGSEHAIRIVLPDGGYIPRFVPQKSHVLSPPAAKPDTEKPQSETSSIDLPATPATHRKRWINLVAILIAVVGLATFVIFRRFSPSTLHTSAGSLPSGQLAVLSAGDFRILCGYQGEKFQDASGVVWLGDRWFTGGSARVRPLRRIRGTRDERLYTNVRMGTFRYDVPLQPGYYELHLYFSESLDEDLVPDSDGEDRRRFDVLVNGVTKLNRFDIVTDAGAANMATERVFKDITPAADGKLHLEFRPVKDEALLNGIEIMPAVKGRMRPIRILCGTGKYSGAANASWVGDSYFRGGVATRRVITIQAADDLNLFAGERYGNFTYAIPVADGSYRVTLRFAEFVFASNDIGRRVFDVNCNGTTLLKDFDILRAAGGERRAVERTLHGLRPNAQGKLDLSFVPSKNYASVTSIEVEDESR